MEKRGNQKIIEKVIENTLKSRKDHKAEKLKISQNVIISSQIIQPNK